MSNCRGDVIALHNGIAIINCSACGYAHQMPRPSAETLEQLYRDEYYQTYNAGWFEKEAREWWYWQQVYWGRLREFEHIVRPGRLASVWDFGAGCGWFIKAVLEYMPEYAIMGFEPSSAAREWASNILSKSSLLIRDKPDFCFNEDFIHASLVLEHVLDPLGYLEEFHRRIKPGGVVCIVVPNEFNPLQQQLARRYGYSPVCEYHINYFTQDSLKALAERAGFEVVRMTATFPMEWFALHGLNYVKRPALGKWVHWLRMVIEWAGLSFAPARWERLRDRWAAKGWGREIELWARKS